MSLVDWVIVAFVAVLAVWGFRQGLIVGVLGLGGLVIGVILGSRAAPLLLEGGSGSPYAPLFALLGGLLGGTLALGIAVSVGDGVRSAAVRGPLGRILDGAGGAILIAAVGVALVWIAGAAYLYSAAPGPLRDEVRGSTLLAEVNGVLPPSGPLIEALYKIDPFPRVAASPGPVQAPDAGIGADPEVRSSARSVVRVSGTSCGLGVMGSGWVVAPGLVVTNAHVVAGQRDTEVQTFDGRVTRAVPVAYEPRNDIAVLAADVALPALGLEAGSSVDLPAAVIGYPQDGPLTVTPARAGVRRTLLADDSYGRGPIERQILTLRASVVKGNSGGPLVGPDGRVLGTVFAATTEGPPGGLAVPNRVVASIVNRATGRVGTGPCAR
ncbi:MAG: MarP family serine protease [Solirubrobacterales bacterium]|nr:MarP family serine protease [Solirubrobacterales bacterium]